MRTPFRWLWGVVYGAIALTTVNTHAATADYWLGMAIIFAPIVVALLLFQRRKLGFWNPLRVFRSD